MPTDYRIHTLYSDILIRKYKALSVKNYLFKNHMYNLVVMTYDEKTAKEYIDKVISKQDIIAGLYNTWISF